MTNDDVRKIVQRIAMECLDDIDVAVDRILDELAEHPGHRAWCKSLEAGTVREMVHDVRHQHNRAIERMAGGYDIIPKVIVGISAGVREVCRSAYDMAIAGRSLGSVLGKELKSLADAEGLKADGYRVNAELCWLLYNKVPAEKTVRESVSEKELRAIIRQAQNRVMVPLSQAGD